MAKSSSKILVVDDIKDWQITISGLLQDKGYDVVSVGSLTEAITSLEKNIFELALLDLRLNEKDEDNKEGLKIAEIIRKRWPKTRILIVTGYGTPEILQKAMEPSSDGKRLAEGYLPKDNTDKLIETVQRILNK